MKISICKPSIKKPMETKTSSNTKRTIHKIPWRGKKVIGFIKRPKKTIGNSIYHRTTVGVGRLVNKIFK